MLTKEQILGKSDLSRETVNVPEWGGDVLIREFSGRQRDAIEGLFASRYNAKTGQVMSTKDLRAKMVIMSVIDDDGAYIFADSDTPAVSGKSAKALDKIVEAVQKLNGMNEEDVETAEKN